MVVPTISNPENFRTNVRSKLNAILNNDRNALNLEKGVYNYTLKEAEYRKVVKKWDNRYFVQLYIDHLRSVFTNLKSETILEQLNSGEIQAHKIAFMTHQEMRPEKWDELIRKKSIKDKNKFENNVEASTDTFTCRKCKSKKCTYYLQQVRSADEPMTCYVTCVDCGCRWKT
jgi:transcription elongation factor S-II